MAKGDKEANKRTEPGLPEIHVQLRIANRLAAAHLKTTMQQKDLVKLLASTGATNQEIADVLDTTPATVATTLQRLKKPSKSESGASNDAPIPAEGSA